MLCFTSCPDVLTATESAPCPASDTSTVREHSVPISTGPISVTLTLCGSNTSHLKGEDGMALSPTDMSILCVPSLVGLYSTLYSPGLVSVMMGERLPLYGSDITTIGGLSAPIVSISKTALELSTACLRPSPLANVALVSSLLGLLATAAAV